MPEQKIPAKNRVYHILPTLSFPLPTLNQETSECCNSTVVRLKEAARLEIANPKRCLRKRKRMYRHQAHGSWVVDKFKIFSVDIECFIHLDKYFAKKTLVDITRIDLAVSKNRGYPQIIDFNRVFHFKPSILGYSYFRKHPFLTSHPSYRPS